MVEFERAYEIDINNTNFEKESYMNFCKDLVDYCNEFGAKIYKNSISVNNIKITKEDTKEEVNARKYIALMTVYPHKKIKKGKKTCQIEKKVSIDGGIVRKRVVK